MLVLVNYFLSTFLEQQFFLLAFMSYDNYVATNYCIMSPSWAAKSSEGLSSVAGLEGCLSQPSPISQGLNLEFCDSNIIDHFHCDVSLIFKISCSNTWFIEQMVIACAVMTFIMTLVCVVLSYIYIINTTLKFPSAQQRKKVFFTYSSHMIVVSITYGSHNFIYIKPSAKEVHINKGVSVLTASIAAILNPFIYTLRNKQVKQAINDSIKIIAFFSKK